MYISGQHYSSKIFAISGQKLQNFAGRKKTRLTQQEYETIKVAILRPEKSTISISAIIQQVKSLFEKRIDKRDIYSVKEEINQQSIREVGYPYYILPFSRSTSPYSGSLNDVSIIKKPKIARRQAKSSIEEPLLPTSDQASHTHTQTQTPKDVSGEFPRREPEQNSMDFIRTNKSQIEAYITAFESEHGTKPSRKNIEAKFNLRDQAVKDWNVRNKKDLIPVNSSRAERSSIFWEEKASRNEKGILSARLRANESQVRAAYISGGIPGVKALFPDGKKMRTDAVYQALKRMDILT